MKTIIGILIILSTSSCATIIKGSKENVYFLTEPSNASVYINGNFLGKTPFYTRLKSNQNYVIDFVADSLHYNRQYVSRKMDNGYMIIDILTACTVYMSPLLIVDAITGAWYKLDRNYFYIDLK